MVVAVVALPPRTGGDHAQAELHERLGRNTRASHHLEVVRLVLLRDTDLDETVELGAVLPSVGRFLDEPFEGVDAVTSKVIRDLLAGFVARGSTAFLTSHILEIVERLCTRVARHEVRMASDRIVLCNIS